MSLIQKSVSAADLAKLFIVILCYFYFKIFLIICYHSSVWASGARAPRALKSARCGRYFMLCHNVYTWLHDIYIKPYFLFMYFLHND